MCAYTTIERADDGPVTTVWLNRPDVRNAINATMIAELTDCFTQIAADRHVRVVILAGRGPVFCAGADVRWLQASIDLDARANRQDAWTLARLYHIVNTLPQPVIARVHGAAFGGAMGLCAVADIVVADPSTKMGFTETRLGIIPAVIGPFVARKIGETHMRRFFLTGEIFTAETGARIGLVHDLVPMDALDAHIGQIVRRILACGPQATRAAKQFIHEIVQLPFRSAVAYGVETNARLRISPEGQEGLRAFLEKRKPAWHPDVQGADR